VLSNQPRIAASDKWRRAFEHTKGRTVVKNNFWKYICMSNPKNDKIVIKRESNIACGLVKSPILEHPLGKKEDLISQYWIIRC